MINHNNDNDNDNTSSPSSLPRPHLQAASPLEEPAMAQASAGPRHLSASEDFGTPRDSRFIKGGGAVETGCSGLHYIIGCVTI